MKKDYVVVSLFVLFLTLVICQDVDQTNQISGDRSNVNSTGLEPLTPSETVLHRGKRAIFTTIALISALVASTASATITTVDLATGSKAFYPSIGKHERNIKYFRNKINSAIPGLQRKQRNLYETITNVDKIQNELKLWSMDMAKIKKIVIKHNITFNMNGKPEIVGHLDELMNVPQPLKTEIGGLTIGMNSVSWVMLSISWAATTYAISTSALVGATAVVASTLSIISIPLSGFAIWMTLEEGKKKRNMLRNHENRLRHQWKEIQSSDQRIKNAQNKIQTFLNMVEVKMGQMLSNELNVNCHIDNDIHSLLNSVKIVRESWTRTRTQFQKLDADWANIKKMIKILIEADNHGNEIFTKTLRKYPYLPEFILKTMKDLNIMDMGTWGPWQDVSKCDINSCGISSKLKRRQCKTQQCIGNAYSNVICEVYYGKMSQKRCGKYRPMSDYYRFKPFYTKIKHICHLKHLPIVDYK